MGLSPTVDVASGGAGATITLRVPVSGPGCRPPQGYACKDFVGEIGCEVEDYVGLRNALEAHPVGLGSISNRLSSF